MTTTNEGGAVVFEALTEEEENLRRRLEDRIEKRLGGIFDDLMEIQRRRLWRSTHGSFENYCRTRWNFGKSRGYQIAAAGQVMTLLLEAGETVVPQNERQARELIASGLQPEDQAILWKFVKETAPNGKISSSHIKSVVGYVREMIVTGGAVDDGSGEMSHISEVVKAGITEDVYERFQRQLTHLNGGANGRKRTYLETREVRSNDAAWVMFQVDKPDSDYIVKLFEEGEDEGEG